MRDYTKYSSRIPSPTGKVRPTTSTTSPNNKTTTTTPTKKNFGVNSSKSHPVVASPPSAKNNSSNAASTSSSPPQQDKREKDNSVSSSNGSTSQQNSSSAGGGGGGGERQPPNNNSSSAGPYGTGGGNSVSLRDHVIHRHVTTTSLTNPSDALSLRRDGVETTIQKLRTQLDEANNRDETAKAALAKSDAVILELRSQHRQLKKQLELLQEEKLEWKKDVEVAKVDTTKKTKQQIDDLQKQVLELTRKLKESELSTKKNAKVGELEIQLDKAHAQILTADMVRKELEDTLEAEQYTWELRVQDQERQIASLQGECDTLVQDLETCRSQWKEAEQGWNTELEELRAQLQKQQQAQVHASRAAADAAAAADDGDANGTKKNSDELMSKIHQLERERSELQSCLDEALKELEAVDAELQTDEENNDGTGRKNGSSCNGGIDPQFVESLQHLLRWIYQEGPQQLDGGDVGNLTHNMDDDPNVIVSKMQIALESWLESMSKTASRGGNGNGSDVDGGKDDPVLLKSQIGMYQEELKNREESSAELRESLKEAVALLKPLQDAVAQTEEEKDSLQQSLLDAEQERMASQQTIAQQARDIESLTSQVSGLGEQLEEQKRLASARQSLLNSSSPSPKKSLQSKGQSTEDSSLAKIQRAREELRRKRETEANLQHLLKDAQSRFHSLHEQNENAAARNRELQGQIDQLGVEEEGLAVAELVAKRDAQIRNLQAQLHQLQTDPALSMQATNNNADVEALEKQVADLRGEVSQREHAERVLNKSLKEALGLLKPLQSHLEEAEQEKMEISKELRHLRKRFRQLQMGESDDHSKSTMGGPEIELIKIKDELEETVRQLEMENSQLHDALEDLTEAEGSKHHDEARLRQNLLELNSRYEVTQNKLEDAQVENAALTKALKHKEMDDVQRNNELQQLHSKLKKTEAEKAKALAIAKASFLKVEELTMSTIEAASREEDPAKMNLDLDMIEAAASSRLGDF